MIDIEGMAKANGVDYVSVSYSVKNGYSVVLMNNGEAGIGVSDTVTQALEQAKKELFA